MTKKESWSYIRSKYTRKDFDNFINKLRELQLSLFWSRKAKAWVITGWIGKTRVTTECGPGTIIQYMEDIPQLIKDREEFIKTYIPAQ